MMSVSFLICLKMKHLIVSLLLILSPCGLKAQTEGGIDYKVNEAKQVLVQTLIEGLPLSKAAIYGVATSYMLDAYDPTKFIITASDAEQGMVVGDGSLVNFFNYQLGFNQYYLDMNFKLRVDAKDSRARISVIADTYSGKCIDGNKTTQVADKIAEYQPVCKSNDSKRAMYTKAFPAMLKTFKKIIDDLSARLKSAQGSSVGDDNW